MEDDEFREDDLTELDPDDILDDEEEDPLLNGFTEVLEPDADY